MKDDTFLKTAMVEEANRYLSIMTQNIKELERGLALAQPQDKPDLRNRLEDMRIEFSKLLANLTIFKAKHGLGSIPKGLK